MYEPVPGKPTFVVLMVGGEAHMKAKLEIPKRKLKYGHPMFWDVEGIEGAIHVHTPLCVRLLVFWNFVSCLHDYKISPSLFQSTSLLILPDICFTKAVGTRDKAVTVHTVRPLAL